MELCGVGTGLSGFSCSFSHLFLQISKLFSAYSRAISLPVWSAVAAGMSWVRKLYRAHGMKPLHPISSRKSLGTTVF